MQRQSFDILHSSFTSISMTTLSKTVRDNLIKNILVVLIAALAHPYLSDTLSTIKASDMGNFLLIISILLVTVCFPLFAFTYEKSRLSRPIQKIISHATTFVFLILSAFLLESMTLVVKFIYPSLYGLISSFSILLYVGIVLYDFWDLLRVEQQ